MMDNLSFWAVTAPALTALVVLAAVAYGLRRRNKVAEDLISRLQARLAAIEDSLAQAPIARFTIVSDKRAGGGRLMGRPDKSLSSDLGEACFIPRREQLEPDLVLGKRHRYDYRFLATSAANCSV